MGRAAGEGKPVNVLSMERRVAVVSHLTDCGSVRATSRQTGVHKTTIISLILKLGEGCGGSTIAWCAGSMSDVLEADEMFAFIHTREQNLQPGALPEHGELVLHSGERRVRVSGSPS